MVLVDTSVWVEHLRQGHARLAGMLVQASVLMHPFVAGELACGNLKNRAAILGELSALPSATRASDDEVLQLIENHRLSGRGIGWIDAHLLTSALLSNCRFWTLDKKLDEAAREAGIRRLIPAEQRTRRTPG